MRCKLLLGVLGILMACVSSAADLKMQVSSAFVGFAPTNGTIPVVVMLRNLGPDATGVLHVSAGDFEMDYPVELPRGGVKRVVTYPTITYAGEISYSLTTNQGDIRTTYRQMSGSDYGAHSALMISQDEGDLGFLRGPRNQNSNVRLADAYVKPENAPDRASAYAGLCAVVLGTGAERLPDAAVRALHNYVLAGGLVVFLGGASSPVLSDQRWADISPVAPGLPKTVQASSLLSGVGESFTILDCKPTPDSSVRRENGNVLVARRQIGLGRTLFFAFNPIEPPFTAWAERKSIFEKFVRAGDFDRSIGYLERFTTTNAEDYYGGGGYYGGPPRPYSTLYSPVPERNADPFSTELPPVTKVFWILVGYFVVIIPINFMLLKKLKRGELAWITAPLISIAFAGAFFAAARDLYSANLSTATQGLVIMTPSSQEAIFVGKSQMFFPRGGTYDLKLAGLEAVGSAGLNDPYGYSYRGEGQFGGLNAIDDGYVHINRMDVTNLAFRELSFRQILPAKPVVETELTTTGSKQALVVRNRSSESLISATAIIGGRSFPIPTLAAGKSAVITIPPTFSPDPSATGNTGYDAGPSYSYGSRSTSGIAGYNDLSAYSWATKQIVIKIPAHEIEAGPGIGQVVAARQSVSIAYFTGIRFGESPL